MDEVRLPVGEVGGEVGGEVKLNLGCGSTKLKGYIGVDGYEANQPDILCDFTKGPLPFVTGTVDEVVMFHCIEHIQKKLHSQVLNEIRRVLKVGGRLCLTYPNFWECAQRWKNNTEGQRDYWHATLFGRQLYPGDYHVCAMDPIELGILLRDLGFGYVVSRSEPVDQWNSITVGIAIEVKTYKDLLIEDLQNQVCR
jgi:SAM-dependent methyltransferase